MEVCIHQTKEDISNVPVTSLYTLHMRHIMSPLQNPAGKWYVRFEVYTALSMMNAVF
jgi:hypothetical protein